MHYNFINCALDIEATFEREFAPLRMIRDHHPKTVLTMDTLPMGENGIKRKNIIDFLLES